MSDDGEAQAPELVRGRMPGDVFLRRRRGRIQTLRRALTVPGLFATGYGNVGSSIYYALGVTAIFALGATPLALMAAAAFFVFTVLSYTEATVAVPEAGGASSFARHGLGEFMSFLAGWATMLSYTVTISISAFAVSGYLSVFFEGLSTYPANVIFTLALIALLMTLNMVGVREATTVSLAFAALDLATQVALVIVGSITLLNLPRLLSQINLGVVPTWGNFFFSISIAMVAYTGIETLSNMVEEARHPDATVPRAYGLLVFAVLVLFAGISMVGLSAMPVYQAVDGTFTTDLATKYVADPVAGIAEALPAPFDLVFKPLVAVLASTILTIAANAGIMGASRLTFSMAGYQQLPALLSRVHPTFRTPYVAVMFFCVVAGAIVLRGDLGEIAEVYVFGAMLAFTSAHLSVIGMRIRAPDMLRPVHLPLNLKVGGYEIPVTAVLGGLGTISVWLVVVGTHPFGRWAGLGWMLLGVGVYVLYRRSLGLPLNTTVRRAAARGGATVRGNAAGGREVRTR